MSTAKTTKSVAADPTVPAVKAIEDTIAATKESMESAVKAGQDAYAKNLEGTIAASKEQFDKMSVNLFKSFDEVTAFNKANAEAVVTAGTVVSKGMEDLGKALFDFSKMSVDNAVNTMKAVMTAKSIREVVELQSEFTKASFDGLLAESAKLSEMSVKVANEVMAPINARVNATVEKFGKPLAA